MVDDVRIEGARDVDEDDILEKIATEATPSFLGIRLPWTTRSLLDTHVLERDIRRINRYYRARGFYDARVESMQIVPDDDEVDVEIRVDEGEPVLVREISLRGHEELPPRERRAVESAVVLREDRRFEEARYDESRQGIVRELRQRGHARAGVDGRVVVDADARTARVSLRVSPGPVCTFRHIRVRGLESVSRTRVLVAMAIERGDEFSDRALENAQSGLFGLGVFQRVSVRPVIHPTEPVVDVEVEVSEADFQRFRAGGGLSADNTRWDVHATVGWEHRNLFGGVQLLRITTKPGVSFSPSLFDPQTVGVDTQHDVDFAWPGFLERETTLIHHGSYKWGNDTTPSAAGICRHDARGSLGFARPITSFLRGTVSYEFQYYKPVDFLLFLDCPDQSTIASAYGETLLMYVNETAVVDLRDDPLATRRGGYFSLSVSESAPGIFSEMGFLSLLGDARGFLQPARRLGLAGRLTLGRAFPLPTDTLLPATLRFFSGGASSVRGYTTNTIGAYPTCTAETKDCLALGGDVKWELSLEIRLQLVSIFRFVVFLDMGDSYLPLAPFSEELDLARHHASLGGGLRIDTPVGPFRFDVAARLSSELRPEEHTDPLDLFGLELPVTIHLALGEAF